MLSLKFNSQPDFIVHASNPSTQEAEARFLQVLDHSGKLSKILPQNKKLCWGCDWGYRSVVVHLPGIGQTRFYSQQLVRDSVLSVLSVFCQKTRAYHRASFSFIFLCTWALCFIAQQLHLFKIGGWPRREIASLWVRCGKFTGFVAICSVTFPIFSVGQSVPLLFFSPLSWFSFEATQELLEFQRGIYNSKS